MDSETNSVVRADWKALDSIESQTTKGLTLFEERVLEGLLKGHSPNAVAKEMGCSPNTIYSRLRNNLAFSKHYKLALEDSTQLQLDNVLAELYRIALEGKSEGTRVKGAETFLKAHARLTDNVHVVRQEISAEDILRDLGIE